MTRSTNYRPNRGGNGSAVVGDEVRVPKMAELVAAQLRRQIIRSELVEGDALPLESDLMAQFGVSRPTIREALRILEAESLISVKRGARGGARVHVPDSELAARYTGFILQHRRTSLSDVYQARAVIEPPCVATVARIRTEADLERLREAIALEEEALNSPDKITVQQVRFHAILMEMCGNQTMNVLTGMLNDIITRATWSRVSRDLGTPEQLRHTRAGTKTHKKIVQLIEQRDAAGAEDLMRRHILGMAEYIGQGDPATVLLDLLD